MQALVFITCLVILSGCTTASRSTAQAFQLLRGQKPPTVEEVAANRFAQALVNAPDIKGLIVLGYVEGERQTWYAGHHAVFYLSSDGLITGVSGMGRAYAAAVTSPSPFSRAEVPIDGTRITRRFDWIPGYAMGVNVVSTIHLKGTEAVKILGVQRTLRRYEEHLEGGGFSDLNVYWVDAESGFIWKSRQHLAPGYAVELTQLKPFLPDRD